MYDIFRTTDCIGTRIIFLLLFQHSLLSFACFCKGRPIANFLQFFLVGVGSFAAAVAAVAAAAAVLLPAASSPAAVSPVAAVERAPLLRPESRLGPIFAFNPTCMGGCAQK